MSHNINERNIPRSKQKDECIDAIIAAIKLGDTTSIGDDAQNLIKTYPDDYESIHLVGVLALKQHRLTVALELLQRALELASHPLDKAVTCAALCETLIESGDPIDAEPYAKKALTFHRSNPEYYKLLARCYSGQGRYDEAIAFLRTAGISAPIEVQSAFFLQIADILMHAGRAHDALPIVDIVEMRQPDNAEVMTQKAGILEVAGNLDEAKDYYMRALKIKPEMPVYYAAANCKTTSKGDPNIELFEKQFSQTPDSQTELKTNLCFALARIHDGFEDYDKAFNYLEHGNNIKRANLNYSQDKEIASFKNIKSFFNDEFINRFKHKLTASGQITPIFIIGMPRSGTTLIESILGAHSQVRAAGELPFINVLAKYVGRTWEMRAQISPSNDDEYLADFLQTAERYRILISQQSHGIRYVTDKSPLNFRFLGLIRLLFPDALILNCQRDPMDTCFSCYQQLFASTNLPFSYTLREVAGYYRLYKEYMHNWSAVLQHQYLDLQYETLVCNFESEVCKLLSYCGLQFETSCLEFNSMKRTVLTASAAQVRRPLYTSAVGKWRRYKKHLGPLLDDLGDLASER